MKGIAPVKPKPYSLEMVFNGLTFKKRTADLDKTIAALKPDMLHTEMYVTVKKGQYVFERRFNLRDARNLFSDPVMREVFINNLLA